MKTKRLTGISENKVLLTLIPIISFCIPFFVTIPGYLGQSIRQGFGIEIFFLGLLLFVGFSLQNRYKWLTCSLIFLLFGANLASLWFTPISDWQVAGGGLFFSDASRYYDDALRLMSGIPYTSFSARHPVPMLFLSSLLWISGRNLKIAMGLITMFAAMATWVSSNEVRIRWGNIPATIFCLLMFLYYRRFSGIPDSENLGFLLGTFSLVLIINSFEVQDNNILFFYGFITLLVGLTARPGAFLIIPAIFLFCWFEFSHLSINRVRIQIICLLCVIFVISFSLISNFLLSEKGSRLFSNYAYTFYGITSGGNGWEQFFTDHPEYMHDSEIKSEEEALQQGWQNIGRNPSKTLIGILGSYKAFFSIGTNSIFGFVGSGGTPTSKMAPDLTNNYIQQSFRLALIFLSLIGLWNCYTRRQNKLEKFLLFLGAGILFSVIFLPPSDAALMRVYAATIPFILIFPIMGVCWNRNRTSTFIPTKPLDHVSVFTKCLGPIVVLLCISPIILFLNYRPVQKDFKSDSSCSSPAIIRIDNGSFLYLVSNPGNSRLSKFSVQYDAYLKSLTGFPKTELVGPLGKLLPDSIALTTIDLVSGQQIWIYMPYANLNIVGKTIRVCGKWDPEFRNFGIGLLNVEKAYPLSD